MKKAISSTAKSSAKSIAATSPPRPGMTQKKSFHSTPQDAAYSRSAMGSTQTPQYSQYQQPPRPQANTQTGSYESKMSYSSSSGDAPRWGGAYSAGGVAYDEDMIEELRPIFAEKARRSGAGGAGTAQMRAMNTGKGDEWVW